MEGVRQLRTLPSLFMEMSPSCRLRGTRHRESRSVRRRRTITRSSGTCRAKASWARRCVRSWGRSRILGAACPQPMSTEGGGSDDKVLEQQ